jgi:serine/threonine protein kinase
MKELAHQNVVRCVDTGISSEGAPYLVIEYIASGCLEDLVVTSGGRLDPWEAVGLICEMLNGLEYIHGQSIIHRGTSSHPIFSCAKRFIRGILMFAQSLLISSWLCLMPVLVERGSPNRKSVWGASCSCPLSRCTMWHRCASQRMSTQ